MSTVDLGVTGVTGVDDEPAPDPADSIDAAIERLDRSRPQLLFESFAESELEWGTTWSTSLKSLWIGEGEAMGFRVTAAGLKIIPPNQSRGPSTRNGFGSLIRPRSTPDSRSAANRSGGRRLTPTPRRTSEATTLKLLQRCTSPGVSRACSNQLTME